MKWLFRKVAKSAGVFARDRRGDAYDLVCVSRPRIEMAIATALKNGDNLVIWGPPHQGKTTLLNRQLSAVDSICIECRPGFKRAQIYRVVLSGLGYAVLVEKKKRGKASATIKISIASTGVETAAEEESEQVMQPVTIDLKNPSEVAHLISRIKNVPRLILNNFQLLDINTKRSILFDLAFFAERPNVRVVIVGDWSNEDYLEEIEPAAADKFKYVLVPHWSEAELRAAATQWSAATKELTPTIPHLDEFLALAAGDISLFRTLVESTIGEDKLTLPSESSSPAAALPIQEIVVGRFQRALRTKLKAIFAERENYLSYLALGDTERFAINPEFQPIPDGSDSDYLRTSIDPSTNQPYSDKREMRLDRNGNPQYIVQTVSEIFAYQENIARFLLLMFYAAAQQGNYEIELATIVSEFAEQTIPKPLALNESRLKAVFIRFEEVQRRALIVPSMLAVKSTRNVMEIVDRRLTLFLQSVSLDDLEDLLDEVQPRETPSARRRNHVSRELTADERASIIQALQVPQEIFKSNEPANSEPFESADNVKDSGSQDNE